MVMTMMVEMTIKSETCSESTSNEILIKNETKTESTAFLTSNQIQNSRGTSFEHKLQSPFHQDGNHGFVSVSSSGIIQVHFRCGDDQWCHYSSKLRATEDYFLTHADIFFQIRSSAFYFILYHIFFSYIVCNLITTIFFVVTTTIIVITIICIFFFSDQTDSL